MSRHLPLCIALCLLLIPSIGSASMDLLDLDAPARWTIGAAVGTYSGPSHADLIFRTNDIMQVMSSEMGTRMTDFEQGTPLSFRLQWNTLPAVGFSATYSYSSYSSSETYQVANWASPREISSNLHDLTFALHYGLDFVRSQKLLPYIGFGFSIVYADTDLNIGLINTLEYDEADPESMIPDKSNVVSSNDQTLAYLGLAGLNFRLTNRIAVNIEMQAIMGDLRQNFEYEGSLLHMNPNAELPFLESWNTNDILGGVYPLDLNGIRLSIGVSMGI